MLENGPSSCLLGQWSFLLPFLPSLSSFLRGTAKPSPSMNPVGATLVYKTHTHTNTERGGEGRGGGRGGGMKRERERETERESTKAQRRSFCLGLLLPKSKPHSQVLKDPIKLKEMSGGLLCPGGYQNITVLSSPLLYVPSTQICLYQE